jgi:hypothetical protein
MKKFIAVAVLGLALTSYAQPNLSVSIEAASGVIGNVGGTSVMTDAFAGNLLVELVWAPSANFSTTVAPGVVDAGFYVFNVGAGLFNTTFGLADLISLGTVTLNSADLGGNSPWSAWAYTRIFNDANTSEYAISALTGIPADPSPNAPAPFTLDVTRGPNEIFDGVGYVNALIPEPSVMALMGLGGLLIAIRRRRMIA